MKKNQKYKLIRSCLAGVILTSSLGACAKNMDCAIGTSHVHLYKNEFGINQFIDSEKAIITKNNLLFVEDNREYLENIEATHHMEREAYVYDYIFGTYYGQGYGYNFQSGKYEYTYGLISGYHWDYEWQPIALDEYTQDLVRDINYRFKFYKVMQDGSLEEKCFSSIEEREIEYDYFKTETLIQKEISSSYYLSKDKQKQLVK